MKLLLNTGRIEDYRLFLAVKRLPRYRVTGHEVEVPDEYASLLGVRTQPIPETVSYEPLPGLFDYQEAVSRLAVRKQKFACFMAPGTGKTLIMLEFARYVRQVLPPDKLVLIVSPLMVIRQTLRECARFYDDQLPIEQIRARDLARWLTCGQGIGITNYEAIVDGLPSGRLGAMLLDESSLLKSHYGKWGLRLIEMGRGLEWKLCLTGTPAPNDRIEYGNHAVFLDQYPTVNAFLARFFVNRGQTNERWELKPHALRPFYRSLSHWSIFLSDPSVYGWKDNVGTLPPVNVHIEDIDLSEQQYQAAMTESGNLFPVAGGITSRTKLAQIAKGIHNGRKIESAKPAYIKRLVDSFDTRSTIIWCRFNEEQDELARLFPGAANIDGRTPELTRDELIADFQQGRRRVLISKPKLLGFGLNLQVCTRMVFSSLQDSYEEYFQAIKRANRYGSSEPLEVFIPITEIERPMVETVLRKSRMVNQDTREQERIFKEVWRAA